VLSPRISTVAPRADSRRSKALAADQALAHAAPQHALEDVAEGVALAEATVAVLGEGRVVWHRRI